MKQKQPQNVNNSNLNQLDTMITNPGTYEPTLSSKRYQKGQMIDKGAYGQVFKGLDTVTNETVAIKYIEVKGTFEQVKKEVTSLKKEITLLKKLNHPNIVKYYDFDVSDDKSGVDIILEYVPNGSIRMALNKTRGFDEQKTAIYTKQVLEGLSYLHKNNIIHRDLKGANLLLDAQGNAKLTDFGTAKQYFNPESSQEFRSKSPEKVEDIAQMNKSLKGTPNWMAPEVISRSGHTISADIWSIGCVVIEMLTGKPPYNGLSAKDVFNKITAGILPEYPKNISEEAKEFLSSCLILDPKKRSSAEHLLQSAFITRRKIQNQQPQVTAQPLVRNGSQDTLQSQEELLRQIDDIQHYQHNTQNIKTNSHPLQTYQKKGSLVSLTSNSTRAPLVVSNTKEHLAGAAATAPTNQLLRMRSNNNNNNNNGLKQQYTFEEYQNTHLNRMSERGRNSISSNPRPNFYSNINNNFGSKQPSAVLGSNTAFEDVEILEKEMQRSMINQQSPPRSTMEFRSPSEARQRSDNKYKNPDAHLNYMSKNSAPQFIKNDLNGINQNSHIRPDNQLLVYKPFVKHEFTKNQPLRSSINDFRATPIEIQSRGEFSPIKQIPSHLALASGKATTDRGSKLGMRMKADSQDFNKLDSREIEIDVPAGEMYSSQQQQSKYGNQVPLEAQNPYLRHENTVINSKLYTNEMKIQDLTSHKKISPTKQPQKSTPVPPDNDTPNEFIQMPPGRLPPQAAPVVLNQGTNSSNPSSDPNYLNKVINTEFTQRNRVKVMQDTDEAAKEKEQKRLAWEQELQKELEYQRQNPLPSYLKY